MKLSISKSSSFNPVVDIPIYLMSMATWLTKGFRSARLKNQLFRGIGHWIEEIHYKESPKGALRLILPILGLLSQPYRCMIQVKEGLYRWGLMSQKSLPAKVISVGNLTTGGSGKTPLTIYLARLLQKDGKKVAILSRGYQREGDRGFDVVSDTRSVLIDVTQAGDEPYMMAKALPGVPVLVGKDRFSCGLKAIHAFGADTILLDDGFQHRRLQRNIDILVVDGMRGLGNGKLLPRGPIREPVEVIDRADIILVTKLHSGEEKMTLPCRPSVPLFTSKYRISSIRCLADKKEFSPSFLEGKKVITFCGIAHPEGFVSTIEAGGANVVKKVFFPDHHQYVPQDMETIRFLDGPIDLYLTTEKDAVKLEGGMEGLQMPIYVLQIDLELFQEAAFLSSLKALLGEGN